jgi:hypothetical protein
MKKLKTFEGFFDFFKKSDEQKLKSAKNKVIGLCNLYLIGDSSIGKRFRVNDDLSVDVYCHVDLSGLKLTKLPVKFNKVNGDFNCSNNQLTSLEGAPKEINGDFNCSNNQLTTLVGSPQIGVERFDCSKNELTSLEGSPKKVYVFDCRDNKLTSLDGAPTVSGTSPSGVPYLFYVGNNISLSS